MLNTTLPIAVPASTSSCAATHSAKGMVAGYLFRRHEEGPGAVTSESAHQTVEEASLFVEAGHACQLRMAQQKTQSTGAAVQVVTLEGMS